MKGSLKAPALPAGDSPSAPSAAAPTTSKRTKSSRPSRFRGRKKGGKPSAAALRRRARRIPDEVLQDAELNAAIRKLPLNYEFEVHKTVWRLRQENSKVVALQFPEGLLMYACVLSDIFEHFCDVRVIIMADVTYGACCVDDFTARALGADFLVHYGHSCLVTVDTTTIRTLYVFVDVGIDVDHLVATIKLNFPDPTKRLTLLGTIQFSRAIHAASGALATAGWSSVDVPQSRPLSAGEVLGCTSPVKIYRFLYSMMTQYFAFNICGSFNLFDTNTTFSDDCGRNERCVNLCCGWALSPRVGDDRES